MAFVVMSLFHFHTQLPTTALATNHLVAMPTAPCGLPPLPPPGNPPATSPQLSAAVKLRQFLCAISVLFVFDCDFINMFCSLCDSSSLIEMFRERNIARKSHRIACLAT